MVNADDPPKSYAGDCPQESRSPADQRVGDGPQLRPSLAQNTSSVAAVAVAAAPTPSLPSGSDEGGGAIASTMRNGGAALSRNTGVISTVPVAVPLATAVKASSGAADGQASLLPSVPLTMLPPPSHPRGGGGSGPLAHPLPVAIAPHPAFVAPSSSLAVIAPPGIVSAKSHPPPSADGGPKAIMPAMRPSDAFEAQVHASIKNGTTKSFPVPPLPPSAVAAMGPTPDVPVPEIFKNRRLRSGKWIKEEEAYADALIDQFESGVAPNCPNGATLRSYLSRMLHCAPMRISKKYAGKGIGKMVFASRIGGLSSSKNADGELRRRAAQVKEKEDKFYKAVHRAHGFMNAPYGFVFGPPSSTPVVIPPHPSQLPFGVPGIHVPFGAVPLNPASEQKGGTPPPVQPPAPAVPPPSVATKAPDPAFPVPSLSMVAPQPAPAINLQAQASTPGSTANPPAIPPVAVQPPCVNSSHPIALNEQTLKLHQSLLAAMQQHQQQHPVPNDHHPSKPKDLPNHLIQPKPPAPSWQPTSQFHIEAKQPSVAPATTVAQAPGHGIGKPLQWRHSQPLRPSSGLLHRGMAPSNATQHQPLIHASHPHQLAAEPQTAFVPAPPPAKPLITTAPPAPSQIDPLKDLASHAPDFLSGFDRVALSLKGSPSDTLRLPSLPLPPTDYHCSPTFTSRSFDDFHRFLGQDLVHLDSPARIVPEYPEDDSQLQQRAGSESAPPLFPIQFPAHTSSAPLTANVRPSAPASTDGAKTGSGCNSGSPLEGGGHLPPLRTNSHEMNLLFSAESYCLFASAAAAASSQHAAYSAPPGALLGMTHLNAREQSPGKGSNRSNSVTIKRNRADTFDMEGTMNIVSAHVGGLLQREQNSVDPVHPPEQERTRTFHCSAVTLPTPREALLERMYGSRRLDQSSQLVSGSEPSTSSATTTETESGNGSSSGNASPNDSDDVEPSDHSGDSSTYDSDVMGSDDDSESQTLQAPKTKKARMSGGDIEGIASSGSGS